MSQPPTTRLSWHPQELESHRGVLIGLSYRMLGGLADAEDAVQETMVRAWRYADSYDGRASLRTWLCRIATRVCLDMAERRRRRLPVYDGAAFDWSTFDGSEAAVAAALGSLPADTWVEPAPEGYLAGVTAGPERRTVLQEGVALAFVVAMQRLAPRQRAALILAEVLGFSAAEVAETLETTVPAVNSALQRARAELRAERGVEVDSAATLTDEQSAMLARFADAFERYDVEALVALLREDATMCMPPYTLWLEGPESVAAWMLGPGAGCRGSRVVPTWANGQPAWAQYRPAATGKPGVSGASCDADAAGRWTPWALVVPIPGADGRITALHFFLDTETLFPRFNLPPELVAEAD